MRFLPSSDSLTFHPFLSTALFIIIRSEKEGALEYPEKLDGGSVKHAKFQTLIYGSNGLKLLRHAVVRNERSNVTLRKLYSGVSNIINVHIKIFILPDMIRVGIFEYVLQ